MRTIKRIYLMAFTIVTFMTACKKNNVEPVDDPSTENYEQLKIGNYWVYELFYGENTDSLTSLNVFDSAYIQKDSVVYGKRFYKKIFIKPSENIQSEFYFRDSLNYILLTAVTANQNIIWFSANMPNDTFKYCAPPIECSYRLMSDRDSIITVPAGSFKTLTMCLGNRVLINQGTTNEFVEFTYNYRYAENVGVVLSSYEERTYYAPAPYFKRWEYRLVRYHVEN